MPASFRQPSFAGGVLAPKLWGRSDFAKYAVGLRTCNNFFITKEGAAVSRPGTKRVAACKVTGFEAFGHVRLIPFVYSDSLSYVLEFGYHYIRFHQNGAPVVNSGGGGLPYEVATIYAVQDLPKLKWAQQGAVMTLCHESYPTVELKVTSVTPGAFAATLTNVDFSRPAPTCAPVVFEPMNVADSSHPAREWEYVVTELRKDPSTGITYESAPARVVRQGFPFYDPWLSTRTYTPGVHGVGTQVSYLGTVWRCIAAGNLGHAPPGGTGTPPNTWWTEDVVTTTPAPYQLDAIPAFPVYPDKQQTLTMRTTDVGLLATDTELLAYRVYRGAGGVLGWIGDTKQSTFTDLGDAPDFTVQPPQGDNPFKVYLDQYHGSFRTERPSCVVYFEQRRLFARTTNRPGFIWGSVTSDYGNFDKPLLQTEASAFSMELASNRLEEIRALVPVGPRLLALTNSAPWLIGTEEGLAYNTLAARRQADIGTSWVDPLVIDQDVLFVRSKGTGIRATGFNIQRQGLSTKDMSQLASHLFQGKTVVDWCYQEDPYGLVWVVLSDGTMASLTYHPEQDVYAWASHDTQGSFLSVCSVPEGTEDAVYVVTQRDFFGSPLYAVERLGSRLDADAVPATGICLDNCTTYSGSPVASMAVQLPNGTVYGQLDGNVEALTCTSGLVTFPVDKYPDGVSDAVIGLPFTPQLETLDVASPNAELRAKRKRVTHLTFEVDNSRDISVGPDFSHLVEWPDRSVSDGYTAIGTKTVDVRVALTSAWGTDGRACLQAGYGVPVTVLGLTREVDIGDAGS